MNAINEASGKSIFSIQLNQMPQIRTYPVLSHIVPLDPLTHERTCFLILRVIKMCRPKTIDQLIDAVAEFTSENIYLDKIIMLYILSLFVIPFYSIQRPNDSYLYPQTPLLITILQTPDKSGIFDIHFSSRITITKQQAILAAWTDIKATLERFGVIIIEQANKKLSGVGYKGPISYQGVQMPSSFRIDSEKVIFLTYVNAKPQKSIQLCLYLQLVGLASRKDSRFQFWQTIEKLLYAFEGLIKKSSKLGQYYGELNLENVNVLAETNITVQATVQTVHVKDWKSTILPMRLKKLYPSNPNPTEKAFICTDRWSVAVILLQAIAIKQKIQFFTIQLQQEEESKTSIDLGKFIAYLQTERFVLDGYFLKKIKSWANLQEQGDHNLYQDIIGRSNSQDNNNFNNISFIELSDIVYDENKSQHNHNEHSDIGTVVALKQGGFIQSELNGNRLPQQMVLSTQELLLNLDFMNETKRETHYVAKRLSESQLEKLEDEMLSDTTFFQMMEFDMKPSTIKYDKCCECCNNTTILINSCGHGKCKTCMLPLIEIAILSRESKNIFKIKCDVARCNASMCYSLIKTILRLNQSLKHKYCQLLLGRYVTHHSDRYVCCRQKNCPSSSTVYSNCLSRVLFCQACNSAFCIDCRRNCHRPFTCEKFAAQQDKIFKEVAALMRKIKWTVDDGNVRECERRLRDARQGEVRLSDSYRMVWEWLVLHVCITYSTPNSTSQGDFLELISEKVAYLMREINLHCKKGTQAGEKCKLLCNQLRDIQAKRKEMFNVIYSI